MPRLSPALLLFVALGFVGCSHAPHTGRLAKPAPWPHEQSDLTPDPAVVWGRLDNGLRYAVLPHPTPRQRVSIFLLVQVGAYYERGSELGYAHFVEHLAFRDLHGVPAGAFATMERLGAGQSPHSNGATGLFETEYRFDNLPTDDPTALPTGLKILRAIADGIRFEPAGVERERGVIFNEARSRDAMMANLRDDELEFSEDQPRSTEFMALFRGTRLVQRPAIGADATLRRVTADKLRAFYDRWYRPERMILTVVGDIEPAAAEELVRITFATLAGRGRPASPPAIEPPKRTKNLHTHFDQWDTEPVTRLTLCAPHAYPGPDTRARRQTNLIRQLALDMLDRRYSRAADAPNAALLSADPWLSHCVPGLELVLLRAHARPAGWSEALATLDFEARRARDQGFTPVELQRVVKTETIRAAAAARQATQRSAPYLTEALAFAIARDVVFTTPADDRDLTTAQLATVTEAQCQAALRDLLPSSPNHQLALALSGPSLSLKRDVAIIEKTINTSRATALTPYTPPPTPRPFPFTDFGPPGYVVKQERSALFDTDLLQFANGVRLNLKSTAFEPRRVRLVIRIAGGRLACPPDQPGLDLRVFAWAFGGLQGMTPEEFGATLTDLSGGFSLNISSDELRSSHVEDTANLPLLLQVAAAHFVHPGFRAEGASQALEAARQITAPFSVTAGGVAEAALRKRMAGGHSAVQLALFDDVAARSLDDLKTWLLPQLASAPLEISIIGDFEASAAIEAVARTFGALPPRATADLHADRRQLAFPPAAFAETVTFNGNNGVATVSRAWPLTGDNGYPTRFRAKLLAKILEQRLWQKLRVEAGEAYILGAGFHYSDTFRTPLDYLECRAEAAPDRMEHLANIIREVAATLAREGVTAEELERARQPFVRDTESGLRDNDWLLDMISVAQSNPAYAEGWARALDAYHSATLDEINALARRVFTPEPLYQLIVGPD